MRKTFAPNDIHRRLLNFYGEQTVGVSTVRRCVARFSIGDSDVKYKTRSGRPCTAVTLRNEERLVQLIRANRRITTRELCTKLNIGFSALETMVATLEYSKVCARWVPRILTQEHKEHRMQFCQDLLKQHEAEGDSFLDRIITGYETLVSPLRAGVKTAVRGVATCEFPIEEKVQDAALSGYSDVHCLLG